MRSQQRFDSGLPFVAAYVALVGLDATRSPCDFGGVLNIGARCDLVFAHEART